MQPVDLSGTTAAKLGDTIDAILIVLLVCEDKDEKAAVLEGRLGFCAAFDALLEAARQAEEAGDPELFTLVERALLQAGERIERAASTLAGRNPPLQ